MTCIPRPSAFCFLFCPAPPRGSCRRPCAQVNAVHHDYALGCRPSRRRTSNPTRIHHNLHHIRLEVSRRPVLLNRGPACQVLAQTLERNPIGGSGRCHAATEFLGRASDVAPLLGQVIHTSRSGSVHYDALPVQQLPSLLAPLAQCSVCNWPSSCPATFYRRAWGPPRR